MINDPFNVNVNINNRLRGDVPIELQNQFFSQATDDVSSSENDGQQGWNFRGDGITSYRTEDIARIIEMASGFQVNHALLNQSFATDSGYTSDNALALHDNLTPNGILDPNEYETFLLRDQSGNFIPAVLSTDMGSFWGLPVDSASIEVVEGEGYDYKNSTEMVEVEEKHTTTKLLAAKGKKKKKEKKWYDKEWH